MDGDPEVGATPIRVFLSHAGADAVAARAFAEILRRNGVDVWFDRDNLTPGNRWMETLEAAIRNSSAMIVYIGAQGAQNWVGREVRYGLELNTRDPNAFKLIPVFGNDADPSRLPPFLSQHQGIAAHDPEGIRRLLDLLRSDNARPAAPREYWATHSPFRSLRSFSPDDAWLFFGRDRETSDLVGRLRRSRVLVVIGNSGSGKSSLIQAGLIPALQRGRFGAGGNDERWNIAVVRPGADPFGELVDRLPRQLAPSLTPADRIALSMRWRDTFPEGGDAVRNGIAAVSTGTERTLLFVDQLEELFTRASEQVRHKYIDALLKTPQSDRVYLVLGLRADFYAHCLAHEELKPALQDNYSLLAMKPDQLREAIEKPLAMTGERAEAGLTDALLTDAGTRPENLALLEHALAELWERDPEKYATAPLTHRRYEEIGRMNGAIARHAQSVFDDLKPDERRLAKDILLQLVQRGESTQDLRRRVTKRTLLALGKPGRALPLIDLLASNRLIATSSGEVAPETAVVEVSHEALIREWSTLQQVIDEDPEDLAFEHRLIADAEHWEPWKEPGALLRGDALLEAMEWLAKHAEAPAVVRAFVFAGFAEQEAAQARLLALERQLREAAEAREQAERTARVQAEQRANRHAPPQPDVNKVTDAPSLRAFLCHSSGDKDAVRTLYKALAQDGFRPWLDEEDLIAGQDWEVEIYHAVRESHVVIVCLSAISSTKAGYIQKEIKVALDVADRQPEGTIFIIPLRLEDCSVPERLKKWHWVDLFTAKGYEKLVKALKAREGTLK